jgi:NADH-quinone oxidoreductase subunit I
MIMPLLKGLWVTLKYFFSKPVTVQYPEEKVGSFPNYRGLQIIRRKPDGSIKCVACGLCEAVCPAKAIKIEIGELEDGMRYPKSYVLDAWRCIFCGYCQEACPVNAIILTPEYENVTYTRSELVLDRDTLLKRGDEVKL